MTRFGSGNECERTHTITTTTTGSKCSQKEANNQTDYQSHNALPPPPPPQAPFCTGSWSWMKSCARHTQPGTISVDDNQLKCFCDQSVQLKHLRLVNLTENDPQLTFKAPCYVALECGLAMDLLF